MESVWSSRQALQSLQRVWPVLAAFAVLWSGDARAEDAVAAAPIGQFVTVSSPIDDQVLVQVKSIALELQSRGATEKRPAILVLEFTPGTSQFHHVQAFTRFLTSNAIANVRTIAWVPDTITGANSLAPLACREIVMHPDAELGDIGRGQPLDPEDQQVATSLGQRRHNPRVNAALIRAMFDPQEQLWRIRVQNADKADAQPEIRTVTRSELDTLRTTGVAIDQAEVIKEAGAIGTFRGSVARGLDILVSQTADSRPAVAALYNLDREAQREPVKNRDSQHVRLIRLEGPIDVLLESFLQRQIDRAVAGGAEMLIFEIQSPGGEMMASINLAQSIANLDPKRIRTVAYIPDMALSGAAIIALGCDEIYMQPSAKIGDAAPLELRPGQPFERAPEKILSVLRTALSSLADKKGRPVALAEAMADRRLKVFQATHRETGRVWFLSEAELEQQKADWIAGPQLRETNGELLLTVDGRRANELLLAERPVTDWDDLAARLALPPSFRPTPIEKTWVDELVFLLNVPAMTVFLFVLAISFLYLELHFPTGMLGILSALCFALFFWSRFLGGTAGWLEVVLFLMGTGCLSLEIFVIPGFGIFGVSGILMILGAVVMASQTFTQLEPNANTNDLIKSLGTVGAAGATFAVLATIMARYLPQIPFLEGVILQPPSVGTNSVQLRPEWTGAPGSAAALLLGQRGDTLSFLRPAGKASFDGRVIDVVSEGPFIPEGTSVEVVQTQGNRIVVRIANVEEPNAV